MYSNIQFPLPYKSHSIWLLLFICQFSLNAQTKVNVREPVYNFGKITPGPAYFHTFYIINEGTKPLVIQDVKGSCSCTQPEWTRHPVAPGDSAEVRIAYLSKGKKGDFWKSIRVNANIEENPLKLYLKGTCIEN